MEEIAALLRRQTGLCLYGGRLPDTLAAGELSPRVTDYYEDEALQLRNAYLTAEAALMTAMELTDCTLRGTHVAVLGYGRIGKYLSRLLCGLGASISGKRILRMAACKKCRLEICFGKSAKSFSALCDNGNMLREPISAKLCVIIELSAAREMLPRDMVAAIEQRRADLLSPENARRLRVIPVSTVSGGGMMYAFRMDGVRIDAGKGFREVDALAAFCTEKIKEGVDALVPAELILNQ